jgi:hypothetical protein
MGLWIWCENKNVVFMVGWKKFAETKKDTVSQVKRESHVASFFLHWSCSASWILLLGQTVNCWYYLEVLKRLSENVRRKRPQMWRNNSWYLHHDNVPANASLLIWDLANTNTTVHPQPPYSPDLALADFLLPKWNPLLKDNNSRRVNRLWKIRRRSYERSQKRHTKTVSRSGNGVGSSAPMQEGNTLKAIRLTQLQASPKKI